MEINFNTQMRNLPLFAVEERLSDYKSILQQELKSYGICFDFHLWVSDEWFCPDGVPGFALPFYLFNKNLMKIHKQETGLVEGRSESEILKLMRHELGHAIDNAFSLRKNKERQLVFGSSRKEYPDYYQPKAYSRNYIHYLGDNYAQSHPDEDFAETFAYWLDPSKRWRGKSFSKAVTAKLNLVDRMMRGVRNKKPVLKNSFKIDAIDKNKLSLRDYYRLYKQERSQRGLGRLDINLKRAFSAHSKSGVLLASFLKNEKRELSRKLARKEGVYQYEAELALKKIIERAEGLGVSASMAELKRKSPTLIRQNFRYLKEKDQLRFYL